jgi:hypothetical protein
MKSFDTKFAEAVSMLLKEAEEKSVDEMIRWENRGRGRWSDVLDVQMAQVGVPLRSVMKQTLAIKNPDLLMKKLNVTKPSESADPMISAGQILFQAMSETTMSETYEKPVVSKEGLTIPLKISTTQEDIESGEGMSPRNLTVYIYLALVGAFNSKMMKIENSIKIIAPEKGGDKILIVKG